MLNRENYSQLIPQGATFAEEAKTTSLMTAPLDDSLADNPVVPAVIADPEPEQSTRKLHRQGAMMKSDPAATRSGPPS